MSSFPYDIEAKIKNNYRQVDCCYNCVHYDTERTYNHCDAFLKDGSKYTYVNIDGICDKYIRWEQSE